MSYALDTKETDASKQDQAYNHFVVFDPYDLIACHDFQVLPYRNGRFGSQEFRP